MDIRGDVLELSRRCWVILNVLCLESPDSCDPLTDFHYKGDRNIFFKVLGALRSKSSALSTMSQSMRIPESQCFSVWTSKLSHMHLALLAHERKSLPAPRVWSINLSSIIPGTMTPGRISTHRCVALDLLSNISESQTHHLQNEDNIYLLRSLSRLCKTRKWRQQAEYMTHGRHLVHDNYLKLMAQLCSVVQNANQFLLCKISSLC